jgi:hypothetical protein
MNRSPSVMDTLLAFRVECEKARLQEARKPERGVGEAARRRASKHAAKLLAARSTKFRGRSSLLPCESRMTV